MQIPREWQGCVWDAVTGSRTEVPSQQALGQTLLNFQLPPCGSLFVVFRGNPKTVPVIGEPAEIAMLVGPWNVRFDKKWGGPEKPMVFENLVDWTARSEPGIRHYSGTAVYENDWKWDGRGGNAGWSIDLGDVRELAEVKLNGKSLGIVWAPPFRVSIPDDLLRPGTNRFVVEVVNFWPNRIIGDATQPQQKRFTRTNIKKLTSDTKLMPSGLLGPVRLMRVPQSQ